MRYDFYLAVTGGGATSLLAVYSPTSLHRLPSITVALVGVVIGAVIAGIAIIVAFLDQAFLRKIKAINRDPVFFIEPFIFTAWLGVVAGILTLVLVALPLSAPTWLEAGVAFGYGLMSVWTITSVVPDLRTLVQFLNLQAEAAEIPDDISSLKQHR